MECSIKHCGIAEVYCEEAGTRTEFEDCRQRVEHAYDHFSHISDVHLATSHPKLAARAREIRKRWEPVIFRRSKTCPTKGACEEISDFKKELVDALEKYEKKGKVHMVAEQAVAEPPPTNDSADWLLAALVIGAAGFTFLVPAS